MVDLRFETMTGEHICDAELDDAVFDRLVLAASHQGVPVEQYILDVLSRELGVYASEDSEDSPA